MRIEIPRETERLGAVLIHRTQRVYELDSGLGNHEEPYADQMVVQRIPYEALHEIEKQMAIVVPMRNERIKLVEGVLCGIPNQCLTIIVSNSQREPVDRFAIEQEAFENFSRFTKKRVILIHQRDPVLAEACRRAGYTAILDEHDGLVKHGKAEGMILATLLAQTSGRRYVGFIDADNYFPGAVLEYVHEYAAGFTLSKSPYTMVRIVWHSKPKVVADSLFFAKWGRVSRNTNRYLNQLIAEYTGFETDVIRSGNAGEHALTMALARVMEFSSGYSVEPYHFINLFEKFGGLAGTPLAPELIRQHVEVYQVESRNPHLHEVKGDEHVGDMTYAALRVIYHSSVCPQDLKESLLRQMWSNGFLTKGEPPPAVQIYPALASADVAAFRQSIEGQPYSWLGQ
ncbi:MAG: mannosyl-3-phosphoglycerate synthase [Chloroflexota bacterium]